MNVLRSVQVEGFWGTKTFTVDFHPDVNFLIGVNGSGKTTLVNMIAAALTADLQTLDRLPFEKLTITLSDVHGQRKPSIEVTRKPKKDSPFPQVLYRIRDRATDSGKTYNLDEFQHGLFSREHMTRQMIRRAGFAIIEHLKTLVDTSWLSIHRAQAPGTREDRSFESTVDRKLDQLTTDLVKYFSVLTRQIEAEQAKFQQFVFLSLIERTAVNLFTEIAKLDLQEETKALDQIFQQFGLSQNDYDQHVKQHFDMVKSALETLTNKKGIDTGQFSALLAMARIDSLVKEWHKFGGRQRDIYKPREDFLGILTRMMVRKTFRVNDKNELVSTLSDSSSVLPLTELSSGEKQLLIILGEALLQDKTASVYIADEPELSMHIAWQVELIDDLRNLNPNAQIIFATHSPDIVSSYGDRVFNMEDILR